MSCLSNICFIVVILYTPSDLGSSGKEYIKTFCIIELIQNVFKKGVCRIHGFVCSGKLNNVWFNVFLIRHVSGRLVFERFSKTALLKSINGTDCLINVTYLEHTNSGSVHLFIRYLFTY